MHSLNGSWRRTGQLAGAGLTALAALMAAPAFAADPAGMGATQIVARNVAARGGEAAWKRIEAISFSGKMDAGHERPPLPDPSTQARTSGQDRFKAVPPAPRPDSGPVVELPYRLELKRPRKSRLELDFAGQTAVQVYDGKDGWKYRPYLGRQDVQPFTADELKIAGDQQELDGLLINSSGKGSRIAADGTEAVEGKPNYRLKVTLKNGDVKTVWVDSGTFLETRVDGTRRFDGKMRTMYTYFRDYRTVDGVQIPHVLETVVDGTPMKDKIVIEKVAINPALPDSHFTKPATTASAPKAPPAGPRG